MKHRLFSIEELLANESFQRWASEDASTSERQYWDNRVRTDPAFADNAREAKRILAVLGSGFKKDEDVSSGIVDAEWDRLMTRLDATTDDATTDDKKPQARLRVLPRVYLRIAAAILLLAIASVMFRSYSQAHWPFSNIKTISTGPGEIATITIPDGSVVILNANSSLRYARDHRGPDVRRVKLLGEAHFDITSHPPGMDATFYVETTLSDIRVLGTQFNVTSTNEVLQVSVSEGLVAVDKKSGKNTSGNETTSSVEISPGQLAEIRRDVEGITLRDANPAVYSSWTGPMLIFDRTPFSEIVSRLERTYGYEVQIQDAALLDIELDGMVENDRHVLLEALSQLIYRPITLNGQRVLVE